MFKMKIAILSDIHGNHYALDSVLREMLICKVDMVFVLGDLIGYYYYPDKVVKLLSDWPVTLIAGNHENMLKKIQENQGAQNLIVKKYGQGIIFAKERLSDQWKETLGLLPSYEKKTVDSLLFELCHGSPWDCNLYVYPDSSVDMLNKCAEGKSDFIFLGHTHYSFAVLSNRTIVANPGSVGQSREKGGVAFWAILDTKNKVLKFKQTPYKINNLLKSVEKIDGRNSYAYMALKRS